MSLPRRGLTTESITMIAALAAYTLARCQGLFSQSFLNDDYVFLNMTRGVSFADLWNPGRLPFHWYRPLSTSLYFWVIQSLFGARELPFFIINIALLILVLVSFYAFVRSFDATMAVPTTLVVATMAAWGATLFWASGAQDLLMILLALCSLYAVARDRIATASVAFALALLSKETAAAVPPLALAYLVLIRGLRLPAALRRTSPLWVIVVLWAVAHPTIRSRLGRFDVAPGTSSIGGSLVNNVLPAFLTTFNAYAWPQPLSGWSRALVKGIVGLAILLVPLLLGWRSAHSSDPPESAGEKPRTMLAGSSVRSAIARWRIGAFGVVWAVLGFLPLLLPSIGWEPYYGLFGSLGVWIAIGAWRGSSRPAALVVIGAMALLQPALADTPWARFGHEAWQRAVGREYKSLRSALLRMHPTVAPHTRFFFENAPPDLALIGVHSAAFQTWYRDTTLVGEPLSHYRPRSPGAIGRDLFFFMDPNHRWIELVVGPEDWMAARRDFPQWAEEHDRLGTALVQAGDFVTAAHEFEKLAEAYPDVSGFLYKAGRCWQWLGRRDLAAARWRTALGRATPGDPMIATLRAALAEVER